MKSSSDHPPLTFTNTRVTRSATFAYDRLAVWIDRPELPFPESDLEDHCSRFVVNLRQARYQARWKLQLEVFQPTTECLVLLEKGLCNDVATLVNYIEIACDLPATSRQVARLQCTSFMGSARMHYQQHSVVRHRSTYYFGRRTDAKVRCERRLVAYPDRPSKLLNARPEEGAVPSMHIEVRLSGSKSLEHEGIASLSDLINFDHQAFWERCLRLYQLPKSKTELGRLIATASGDDPDVSGSALRKRASRWLNRHSFVIGAHKVFIMHNALRGTPELKKTLRKITFSAWLHGGMLL